MRQTDNAGTFVPVAELYGLIIEVDRWMVCPERSVSYAKTAAIRILLVVRVFCIEKKPRGVS